MALRIDNGSPFVGGQPKPIFTQPGSSQAPPSIFNGKASNLNSGMLGPALMNSSAPKSPSGAATLLGALKTAGSNIVTNVGGANSRIWNWLTGKPQQQVAAAPQQPQQSGPNPWNTSANSDYSYQPDPSLQQDQAAQDQGYPDFNGNWADYLKQAQSVAGSNIANQLAALAASRDQMQKGYTIGDQQLAQMYDALKASTQQDNAAAAQRYAEAQKAVQAQTDQAQQALTGANTTVAGTQDLMNANLDNKLVNPNGGLSVAQQAQLDAEKANNARLQTQGQSNYDSLVSGGQAQQDYGQAMGSAAQFAGADRRSQLKNALMTALSAVAQQEAQLKDSQGSQASSLATQMYNSDYQKWLNDRNYQADRQDQAWQQAYQQQQLDNSAARYDMQYGQQSQTPSKGPQAAVDFLQNSAGLDPNTSAQVTQQLLDSIAQNQGNVSSGGKSLTPYQAGMLAVQAMDPQVKGAAMMALYQMTGGF